GRDGGRRAHPRRGAPRARGGTRAHARSGRHRHHPRHGRRPRVVAARGGVSEIVIGAYAHAEPAGAALAPRPAFRRAAVLPRGAVGDEGGVALRDAGIECLTTLDAGGPAEASWLARELADAEGWALADGAGGGAGAPGQGPGDVVGWYELRVARRAL